MPQVSVTYTTSAEAQAQLLLAQQQAEAEALAARALCEELGERLGSVSVQGCLSHQLQHSGQQSVQGRALLYKDYLPASATTPKILLVGGVHGDEYSSFSLLFRWLERLDQREEHMRHWRLLPAVNPDGLLGQSPAQRTNANGVDINRNFASSDWEHKAKDYWRNKAGADPRRNPGEYASSEPETQWLSELVTQWQPDVIISVHAPYGILDFDSPQAVHAHLSCTTVPCQTIRIEAPDKIGFLHLDTLGTYPGSLGRFAAHNHHIPVLTMELPHAGIMPSEAQLDALWQDLSNWLEENLPLQEIQETTAADGEQIQALNVEN